MIDLGNCTKLGYVKKAHGVQGYVAIVISDIRAENILNWDMLFIQIDGLPVPFFVEDIKSITNEGTILKFSDIISTDEISELIGNDLYIPNEYLSPLTSRVLHSEKYIGYTVVDTKLGKLGELIEILDLSSNKLFKLFRGDKEILFPAHEKFIEAIDDKNKKIRVNAPDGFEELY